jgi:hypothetical protein
MPDEHLGLGPAGIENPEAGDFASRDSALRIEKPAAAMEQRESAPEETGEKYSELLTKVSSAVPNTDDDAKVDLTHLRSLEGEEEKVEHLVKLAKTKGLPHAVTVAQRLKDYYALDKFHDELIDNLYEELVREGLVTKE